MAKQTIKCPKCYGTGRLPQYANIAAGVCFKCEGNGSFESTIETAAAKAKREAKAEERAKVQAERWAATLAEVMAIVPEGHPAMEGIKGDDSFTARQEIAELIKMGRPVYVRATGRREMFAMPSPAL